MNNAIKLSTIHYTQRSENTAVFNKIVKAVYKSAVAFYTLFCLAVYAVEYTAYEIKRFCCSDTAKGLVLFYKLYLRMWVHAILTFATVTVLFGMVGLIVTLSLAIPAVLMMIMLSDKRKNK